MYAQMTSMSQVIRALCTASYAGWPKSIKWSDSLTCNHDRNTSSKV